MNKQIITFDQLPDAVQELNCKIEQLKTLIIDFTAQRIYEDRDRWMTIEELSDYLPGKPAITTLYGKVQRREIPCKRMAKRLVFLKSEIDQWLKGQHRTTHSEINAAAEQYLSTKERRRG